MSARGGQQGFVVSYWMAREALSGEVTLEEKPAGGEKAGWEQRGQQVTALRQVHTSKGGGSQCGETKQDGQQKPKFLTSWARAYGISQAIVRPQLAHL